MDEKDEGSVGDACYEWWLIGDRRRLEDGKYRHFKRGGTGLTLSSWMLKATCSWRRRVQKFEYQKKISFACRGVGVCGDPKTPIQLLFSFLHVSRLSCIRSLSRLESRSRWATDFLSSWCFRSPSVMIPIFSSASERDTISCGQPHTKTLNSEPSSLILPRTTRW